MKKYVIFGNAQSVHLVKWVKELVKYFKLYVISSQTTHKEISSIVPKENIFNLNLKIKESGGNVQILQEYNNVKDILKQISPDFVNAHYITSHGFLVSIIKRTSSLNFKLIQSAWGSDILVTPFKNAIYKNITKFALNSADLTTSDSKFMTSVINKLSKVRTTTFFFGIDNLPDINLEQKDKNLFFSNRILSKNYNIDKILYFFKKIHSENEKAKLIITNDGPMKDELKNYTISLGIKDSVEFNGFISLDEQKNIYKKACFFISIPTSDSTSVSLIEAMAYGCIPIVSKIPANMEWVDDKKNGLFFNNDLKNNHITEILHKYSDIFTINRKIINEKAIFPDSIKKYVKLLKSL